MPETTPVRARIMAIDKDKGTASLCILEGPQAGDGVDIEFFQGGDKHKVGDEIRISLVTRH